jgi:serine/threonine protein kinase
MFENADNIYIVLELCINKTLSDMLKNRKKLTAKETRYFMWQVVSALSYIHNNQVIHRDLTMGNIFLNESMDVKIGDFGLSAKI